MTPKELRARLRDALTDPRRRQLAHVAVLDIAMAAREALDGAGLSAAEAERATEELSALLRGEIDDLPQDLAGRVLTEEAIGRALERISQEPAFAPLFR